MKRKTYLSITLVLILCLIQFVPAFAADEVKIVVDGKEADVDAFIKDGSTYIPIRFFVELFGGKVDYKDKTVFVDTVDTNKKSPVKVTTLIENSNLSNPELTPEHGISMYIETEEGNILFDTGKSDNYIENAKKLGIDMKKTNYMVLSHAHYDHCGGVKGLIEKVKPEDLTLYIRDNFFKYNDKYHYQEKPGPKLDFTDGTPGYTFIGIDFDEKYLNEKNVKVEYIDVDELKLTDQVSIFSNFGKSEKEKLNPAMKVKVDGEYKLDEFVEEVAIAIDTNNGIVILTGCSHTGIMNIVDTIHEKTGKDIYAVIGGTHLIEADDARTEETIKHFKELGIQKIGLSHCTGEKAVNIFEQMAPDISFVNSTGTVLEFK